MFQLAVYLSATAVLATVVSTVTNVILVCCVTVYLTMKVVIIVSSCISVCKCFSWRCTSVLLQCWLPWCPLSQMWFWFVVSLCISQWKWSLLCHPVSLYVNVSAGSVPQCYCSAGYRGVHCHKCDVGLHRVVDASNVSSCVACNCSGNENKRVQDFCDELTGLYSDN